MTKKLILILVLLLVLIGGTGIVSAELVNGTVGTGAWNTTNYEQTTQSGAVLSGAPHSFHGLYLKDIEKVPDAKSFIYWWTNDQNFKPVYDTGAPSGAQTTFVLRLTDNAGFTGNNPNNKTGRIIAGGTIAYTRIFNLAGVEQQGGNIAVLFDTNTWNTSGLSGNQILYLDYNDNLLYNMSWGTGGNTVNVNVFGYASSGYPAWVTYNNPTNWIYLGLYTFNQGSSAYAYFDLEKPKGFGIQGFINKTNGNGGTILYPSRIFISDINHQTIQSEGTINSNPQNINLNANQIYISLYTNVGQWVNSSLLFSAENPIPEGTHNITFHIMTYQGTGIYNAKVYFVPNLQVGQVPADVAVTGYTNASGMVTFTNQAASSAAYVGVTASGFKDYVETFTFTSDMVKEIRLSPPSVDVNLDIRDSSTGYYLENVDVGIQNTTSGVWRNSTQEVGSLFFDSTGANYEYPISINETVIVAASKAGYRSNWKSVTIPSSILYNSYTVTLYLINLNATAPSTGNFTAVVAVSHKKTGTVIQGASVAITALGRAGTTGTTGAVTFRNIAAGTYTMTASAPGFNPSSTEITGADGETVLKSIALVPTGCSVSEGGVVICGNETSAIPSSSQNPNTKASNVLTMILDNAVTGFWIIVIILGIWFAKKAIFS